MITWNTDCDAPCCPGEIVNDDGRTLLIQSDWEYCATAETFGWSLRSVQHDGYKPCRHDATDGTVDCPDCGITNSEFMAAAYDWLRDHNGATAEDPGFFA